MPKTNQDRLNQITRLKRDYQELQYRARQIVNMYDGMPPKQLQPHYPEWQALARDAKAIRNQINLLAFPHEWYLKP